MVFGLDDALAVASIGSSLLGSRGNKSAQPVSTLSLQAQALQDAYNNGYLPAATENFNRPYPSVPTKRASDPASDPFASQAMWELQQLRDNQAYNVSRGPGKPQEGTQAPQGMSPDEMFGRSLMAASQNDKGGMGMAPVFSQTMAGGKKIPQYANPQNSTDYGLLGKIGAYQQDNPMQDWRQAQPGLGAGASPLFAGSLGYIPQAAPTAAPAQGQNPEDPLLKLRSRLGG